MIHRLPHKKVALIFFYFLGLKKTDSKIIFWKLKHIWANIFQYPSCETFVVQAFVVFLISSSDTWAYVLLIRYISSVSGNCSKSSSPEEQSHISKLAVL